MYVYKYNDAGFEKNIYISIKVLAFSCEIPIYTFKIPNNNKYVCKFTFDETVRKKKKNQNLVDNCFSLNI